MLIDNEAALNYLRVFGLEAYVSDYIRYGGYALGLMMARQCAGVTTPTSRLFPLDEMKFHLDQGRVWEVLAEFPNGFTVKYSGHREAFSPFSTRGVQSSRNRFWDGNHANQARLLLEEAEANAPSQTQAIILQEYVRYPALSSIVHAYGYHDKVLMEFAEDGQRVLATLLPDGTIASDITRCAGPSSSQRLRLRSAFATMRSIRDQMGFDVDIECFQHRDQLIVVQLRPIPHDVSIEDVGNVTKAINCQLVSDSDRWYITPWVYGVWSESQPLIVNEDIFGQPAIMAKRIPDIRTCADILRRLRRGEPTLVVDCVDAFRLTHDPRQLPEDIVQRTHFSYVSVANSPLANVRDGEAIAVLSDGDRAILRRDGT